MPIYDKVRIKLNSCPKCNSNKVYLVEAVIEKILCIKRTTAFVYCEQCGYKGKVGHTNTSAVAYWNGEIKG